MLRFRLRTALVAIALVGFALAAWIHGYPASGTFPTGRDLDVAVFGRGYFQVADHTGQVFYTRQGDLAISSEGVLVVGRPVDNLQLVPTITVPADWTKISLAADGDVRVEQSGAAQATSIGLLNLARFINPEGLAEVAPGLYAETSDSGIPTSGAPGTGGLGVLRQGWLERDAAAAFERVRLEHFVVLVLALVVVAAVAWCAVELRRQRALLNALLAGTHAAPPTNDAH